MRPQLLMAAIGIFIFGTIFACIASGRWLLNGETNIINALASFNTISISAGGGWNVPKALMDFFDAIITAFTWSYPYLSDPWAVFVKIPLWLISIGVIWGFIEVASTVVQGVIGSIRSLIGT